MEFYKFKNAVGEIDLVAAYIDYAWTHHDKEVNRDKFTPGIDLLVSLSSIRPITSRQVAAMAILQAYMLDYPTGVY